MFSFVGLFGTCFQLRIAFRVATYAEELPRLSGIECIHDYQCIRRVHRNNRVFNRSRTKISPSIRERYIVRWTNCRVQDEACLLIFRCPNESDYSGRGSSSARPSHIRLPHRVERFRKLEWHWKETGQFSVINGCMWCRVTYREHNSARRRRSVSTQPFSFASIVSALGSLETARFFRKRDCRETFGLAQGFH